MSSTYTRTLPTVFPFLIKGTPYNVNLWVRSLLDPRLREDVSQGSSFAVTVDNWNGTWNLWLSEVSKNFLMELYGDEATILTSVQNGE